MDYSSGGWGWLALALVNAGLAEQKNRSRWSWFVISLLIGPLATAIIVIRPRADAAQQQEWTAGMLFALTVVLAAIAIAATVGAIMSSEWALWIVCAVAALGAVAFGYTALRSRTGSVAQGSTSASGRGGD
ncbi:hypothetical protein G3T36_07920 [Diaminobutyricibacter tongyongensis]|uniref:Uncharacterized protein n=1 Tax=Leifsonia tongyongensis TaxID=1268043 RepID=A0A6L9XXS3_9MICO|nr:hypothetical protein [Diaminobutyricibacter tongyongensis]NEN05798.1 hypothetical protein [Diaminobutyricibacter tongyongensis]